MQPLTKYAHSGDVNIAYQAIGEGPPDLVLVHGWVSNVDETWTEASLRQFQARLARARFAARRSTGVAAARVMGCCPTHSS